MRIVNAMSPAVEAPKPLQPSKSDASDSIPEELDIQKVHPMSVIGKRRAYKNFILAEASRRRAEMVGLTFVHCSRSLPGFPSFGGVTVAFKLPNQAGQAFSVEIASCVCPTSIQLDKKFGSNFAALNFLNRRTIQIPVVRKPDGESAKDAAVRTISEMFS